ncbi:MAG TPA: hypothetical protein VMH34_09060 [Gammaproteobacteria bacterium]|nr:hypothetical protein [Gammaproteobacteria bacterium]
MHLVSAQMNGDCGEMYALVDAGAKSYVDNLCLPRKMTLLGREINLGSPAGVIAETRPAGTPFTPMIKLERTIESQTTSDDGAEVYLVVTEKSYQHSFSNWEPAWLLKHEVTVRKTDAGWKIIKFSEEVLRDFGGEKAATAPRPPVE